MEQPTVPVVCTCGYDGKLTSPLCPLHGERGLTTQVDRLRTVNAKLLEALEELVARIQIDAFYIKDSQAFKDALAVVSREEKEGGR